MGARSLRVAIVFPVIILIFFAVAFVFLFVFFLVWLLPQESIGSDRPIRSVCVGAFWMYSAHVPMVRLTCLQTRALLMPQQPSSCSCEAQPDSGG